MASSFEPRNWSELPPVLTSSILVRLPVEEILENAQKVCRSWRRVCKDPSMWRKIKFRNQGSWNYDIMCRHAVGRSQGGLLEIDVWRFGTDSLLGYIAHSSSNLRCLRLVMCYSILDDGLVGAVVKLALLEELELSYCTLSRESLKAVGKSCPNLKTLKLIRSHRTEFDNDAIAIAETMPELRHLELFGNKLTNTDLNAILDGCPNLKHLDLRRCFSINLVGDMEKRCFERIKDLRRPNDSVADFPFLPILSDIEDEEFDDDYSIDSDEYVYHIFGIPWDVKRG